LSIAALLSHADAASAAHVMPLASTAQELAPEQAHAIESFLRPLLALFTLLNIVRIPMTWYPSVDGKKLPWSLAYIPTEPILSATRKVVPLVGGVDVTPIVWVALLSFVSEILLGPQGILMLIQRQAQL
jgi:YggT family protein